MRNLFKGGFKKKRLVKKRTIKSLLCLLLSFSILLTSTPLVNAESYIIENNDVLSIEIVEKTDEHTKYKIFDKTNNRVEYILENNDFTKSLWSMGRQRNC